MIDRDQAAVQREIATRRRAQAFQMRREGTGFEAIATRLGVTRQAARAMVAREVRALSSEADTDERRLIHAEALMDLWRAFHGPASEGDMAAADTFLRVEERLASLLGLDHAMESVPPGREARSLDAFSDDDHADSSRRVRRFVAALDGDDRGPAEPG